MHCRHCRYEIPDDSTFCVYCGADARPEDAASHAPDAKGEAGEPGAAGDKQKKAAPALQDAAPGSAAGSEAEPAAAQTGAAVPENAPADATAAAEPGSPGRAAAPASGPAVAEAKSEPVPDGAKAAGVRPAAVPGPKDEGAPFGGQEAMRLELLDEERNSPRGKINPAFLPYAGNKPQEVDAAIAAERRRRLIVGLVSACVLVLAAVAFVFWWTSADQRIRRNIDLGHLDRALAIYQEELSGQNAVSAQNRLRDAMSEKIDLLFEQYERGAVEADALRAELESMAAYDFFKDSAILKAAYDRLQRREDARALMAQGEEAIKREDYFAAYELFLQITSDDPLYEQSRQRLAFARSGYETQVQAEALALIQGKDFDRAIELLKKASERMPDSELLRKKLMEIRSQKESEAMKAYLSEAAKLAMDGYYLDAIDLLRSDSERAKSDEVQKAVKIYGEQYVSQQLRRAENALEERDFETAIEILENAMYRWYDTALESRLGEVREMRPTGLNELSWGSDDSVSLDEGLTDNQGNGWSGDNLFRFRAVSTLLDKKPAVARYYLEGQYVTLDAMLVLPASTPVLQKISVSITDENGRTLYTSPELSATTAPVPVTIDVSGVQSLYVNVTALDILPVEHVVYLANPLLYKQYVH